MLNVSPIRSVNVSIKNQAPVFNSNKFCSTPLPNDSLFVSMKNQMGDMNLNGSHNYGMVQGSSQY